MLSMLVTFSYALVYTSIRFADVRAMRPNYTECAVEAIATHQKFPNCTFLSTSDGKPTNDLSQAWGVNYQWCTDSCTSPNNYNGYDWSFGLQGLGSWVIPWLALTAQLPFGTRSRAMNLWTLCLAIGSPPLIAYSLALSILNTRSINKMFWNVKDVNKRQHHSRQMKMIKAARTFFIESRGVSIKVYNGVRREFAQLVVRPANVAWWCGLRTEILKTKKERTLALYAQIGSVCFSQVLAIINYFQPNSVSNDVGIGLAINSLWTWELPIVLGWVYTGTQKQAGSITAALTSVSQARLVNFMVLEGESVGIRDRTSTKLSSPAADTFVGYSIAGYECEPGTIFIYARVWSHMNAVGHAIEAFTSMNTRQGVINVQGQPWITDPDRMSANFEGSPEDCSRYISSGSRDEQDLSVHKKGSSELYRNCIYAALVAMFLQWGTTGAAIVIAYGTPVIGLGCQSLSYLMYGVLATASWLMLLISAYLSHRWSLHKENSRLRYNSLLGPAAVMTRKFGELFALTNFLYVIVISIIQMTSILDNCWCDACILTLGKKAGWVILFASDAQIAVAARSAWIGGVSMSIGCAAIVTAGLYLSRGDEIYKQKRQ